MNTANVNDTFSRIAEWAAIAAFSVVMLSVIARLGVEAIADIARAWRTRMRPAPPDGEEPRA